MSPSARACMGFVGTMLTSSDTTRSNPVICFMTSASEVFVFASAASPYFSSRAVFCSSGRPLPGSIMLATAIPMPAAMAVVIKKNKKARSPILPTLRMSPKPAAPKISETKTRGTTSILTKRMKISPIQAVYWVMNPRLNSLYTSPTTIPAAMPIRILVYNFMLKNSR